MNVDTPSPYRLRGIWSGTDDMALQGRRQTRPVFPIAVADHSHRTARTGVHTCLPARYGPHRAMSARPVPTFISMTERHAAGENASVPAYSCAAGASGTRPAEPASHLQHRKDAGVAGNRTDGRTSPVRFTRWGLVQPSGLNWT